MKSNLPLYNLAEHGVPDSGYDFGVFLGQMARDNVVSQLVPSADWALVNSAQNRPHVARMADNTARLYPVIYDELRGVADGLQLPLMDVLAWNFRGDLWAVETDGCTTVQLPQNSRTDGKIHIAHNEDGLSIFDKHCFLSQSDSRTLFCYPGSIPGHSFWFSHAGLVVTVNHLGPKNVIPEIPRMVLTRAVIGCDTIDDIRHLLNNPPPSGGFHLSVAHAGDNRLYSIEFGAGQYVEKIITTPSVHANHPLLGNAILENHNTSQSSISRQNRGDALITNDALMPLDILWDTENADLPIWRRIPNANDATLAVAVFQIGTDKTDWQIYYGGDKTPLYTSS